MHSRDWEFFSLLIAGRVSNRGSFLSWFGSMFARKFLQKSSDGQKPSPAPPPRVFIPSLFLLYYACGIKLPFWCFWIILSLGFFSFFWNSMPIVVNFSNKQVFSLQRNGFRSCQCQPYLALDIGLRICWSWELQILYLKFSIVEMTWEKEDLL